MNVNPIGLDLPVRGIYKIKSSLYRPLTTLRRCVNSVGRRARQPQGCNGGSIARPFYRCGKYFLGIVERKVMKPRLLIRALCAGGMLLALTGGASFFSIEVVGATTTITTVATSNARFGTLFSVTMVGISCTVTGAATHQCEITKQGSIADTLTALISGKLLITVSGAGPTIHKVSIKAINVVIKSKGTNAGVNGCKLLTFPRIVFSGTTNTKWTATTASLSAVTVTDTSSVGECTTRTLLQSDITGHSLGSTLTFS